MSRRAALVTGGARRIGRAIALHLAGEGWDVGVHYRSSGGEAQSLAREIEAAGAACGLYAGDVAEPDDCRRIVEEFVADFPSAALLVNNASTYHHDTIDSLTPEHWNAQLGVNTLAPILLARAFHGAGREAGCVVNLLDQKVINLSPDYFSYTISKGALHDATVMLAMAFAPKTRVNGIAPGLVLPSGALTTDQFRRLHAQTPLGVGATPGEICDAVSYIARTKSMTGQMIVLDGGRHLVRNPGERDLPTA